LSRIFWDTNLFIYWLEDQGDPARHVARLRQRMKERGDQLCTSTLTLGEVLVKPLEKQQTDLVERYGAMLLHGPVMLIPFDRECARIYAQVRKDRSIRAPDVIQLACAGRAGCDLFITNDERLSRKVVPGVQFIVPLNRAYL